MHELGIMTGVVEAVKGAAANACATKVYAITLSVGEMTEAIPDALEFAFDVLKESEPLLAECELTIHMVRPKSRCLECGAEYEHDRFHMLCPECESPATTLLAGRDLRIESMEAEVPEGEE
ncbi:MAG: hydrogenase maturation nickel metallochaperone HypA [Coriobacteriia bacterium]|nr:hydrogenase maturation nickel metallochaperone HypA [Coriobacteriia bacterium]